MHREARAHPTIGFLSTWSVYEGTAIDSYSHTLFQGICTAAREQACNLLLGCGISLPGSPRASRTVWAVPGTGVDFVPIGPWNTDGLIVVPDDLSDAQFEYIQALIRSGYPVVLTTTEKPGPAVAVDNAGGIRQAFDHLWQHGHRRIAFIAGKSKRGGDSAERLAVYRAALCDAGIEPDARLIAFGEHRREDGRAAMQHILSTGAPFTAVLASNDLSCLGAMEALRAVGRRVPDDIAVIGFDDILEARSHFPPLTTVRHPTFTLGYQAVVALYDTIVGKQGSETHARVPTQLVIRQSCGCRPESTMATKFAPSTQSDLEATQTALARVMAEAAFVEARHTTRGAIEALCPNLVRAFVSSLAHDDSARFDAALKELFGWLEAHSEDAHTWHAALSALRQGLPHLLPLIPGANLAFADSLIDRARRQGRVWFRPGDGAYGDGGTRSRDRDGPATRSRGRRAGWWHRGTRRWRGDGPTFRRHRGNTGGHQGGANRERAKAGTGRVTPD
jgi:ABC-type sugar transport system substrate-binding protein